jgi:serine/threonine protein kinase
MTSAEGSGKTEGIRSAGDGPTRATSLSTLTSETRIIPKKTAFGSYVIVRKIAAGGMGEVWEGWLIPSAELGGQLLRGERRDLRKIAGVASTEDELTREEKAQIAEWVRQRTEEFLKNPPEPAQYRQMMEWVSPHRRLGQDYRRAIKILNPELAKNPDVVLRFVREIEFLARLNHPNIVKVVESGQSGPHHFAAMEYVDATPLEGFKLSIPGMSHVIRQALEGLIHAHEQGVLHRDLKPGNILVREDMGAVKLTDFGIAKAIDEAVDGQLTATGVIIGTPFYLDPERVRGEPSVEGSDLYSLGATFYRLLTGEAPAKASRPMDAVALIQSASDPRWVREINPRVSDELEDLVMMMLSKDLKLRLSTFEVRSQLKYLDENNALLYREATAGQRRQDARAARRVMKEIRSLRSSLIAEGEGARANSIRKLYALYEDWAELQPRDEERGVNLRLGAYEEALAFHQEHVAPRGATFSKGVKDRVSLLEKRRALELRRLERKGFQRGSYKPRRWGRTLLFTAASLLIVTMAILFGHGLGKEIDLRRRTDEALQTAEEALASKDLRRARTELEAARLNASDLPLSSPKVRRLQELEAQLGAADRYERAVALQADLRRQLDERRYAKAAEDIESIRRILDQPTGESPLAAPIKVLLAAVEEDAKRIELYSADIKVYSGLLKALDEIEARVARLRVEPAAPEATTELSAKFEAVALKLLNPDVVSPHAIGPAFEETGRRLAATRASIAELSRPRPAASGPAKP